MIKQEIDKNNSKVLGWATGWCKILNCVILRERLGRVAGIKNLVWDMLNLKFLLLDGG